MKKIACQCGSGCRNNRCPCFKAGQPCSPLCGCQHCKNPLNSMEQVEFLSDCARAHMKTKNIQANSYLRKLYKLPCECGRASLNDLLKTYHCSSCDGLYYYSFCLNKVVDEHGMWHCHDCGTCREGNEWHCKYCDACTWGNTWNVNIVAVNRLLCQEGGS